MKYTTKRCMKHTTKKKEPFSQPVVPSKWSNANLAHACNCVYDLKKRSYTTITTCQNYVLQYSNMYFLKFLSFDGFLSIEDDRSITAEVG